MAEAKKDFERIWKDGWTNNLQDPTTAEIFESPEDAFKFFQKTKSIMLTDGSSFEEALSCIKIRTSEMPKLLKLVYDNSENYEFEPKFDGNNIDAGGLYTFEAWNEINDMRA